MKKILKVLITILIPIMAFLLGLGLGENLEMANYCIELGRTETEKDSSWLTLKKEDDFDLSLFWEVWDIINDKFIYSAELDSKNALYGAIYGLVNSMQDPYTVFLEPNLTEDFMIGIEGAVEGIGVELIVEDGLLTISGVLKGSPAKAAGLQPRDIIYKVNEKYTTEMTLMDAVHDIRGAKGTEVSLTILRAEEEQPLEYKIIRDEVKIDSVTWEVLEGNVFYLSINQFTDNTDEEFEKAVKEILDNNYQKVILDLRYNPGGYMDTAVNIAKEFIEEEVKIKRAYRDKEDTINSNQPARLADVKLVVLVNEGSASASEIVAGAIQDFERGVLIGTQTYGKGSVQDYMTLPEGASLKVTIAKWFTPKGRDIDGVGLEPDIEVEFTDEDYENGEDPQLDRAIELLQDK